MSGKSFFRKNLKIFTAQSLILLLFMVYFFNVNYSGKNEVKWGVTYSPVFASSMGLSPRETYRSILDDLGVTHLRLSAYWSDIEKEKGRYDFGELDWYIRGAEARGVKVTLAVGRRLPRWPECHIPSWARMESEKNQQTLVLSLIKEVVNRYKSHPSIVRWQIENEPLLNLFGECSRADKNFLIKEIEVLKSLDSRPVMVTDSGELSTWRRTVNLTDNFGTTIYRRVWNKYFGYFNHFVPPAFYNWKARLYGRDINTVVVSELQAEPWVGTNFVDSDTELLKKAFDLSYFRKNIEFAAKTGIGEIYLWGAEYWYYLKEKRGDPSFWEEAKKLWQKNT